MSQIQNLPLYSSSYAYSKEIYRIKLKLPKSLRHDLGQEIFGSALKILKCLVVANRAQEKTRHLSRLLLEIEVQWTLLRLLFDLRGISEGEFKVLSERLSNIEKQSLGWLNWQKNMQPSKQGRPSDKKEPWQSNERGLS